MAKITTAAELMKNFDEKTMEEKLETFCYSKIFPLINFRDQHMPDADIEKTARTHSKRMAEDILFLTREHKTWLE